MAISLTLQTGIQMLQGDHENGARILATKALHVLKELATEESTKVNSVTQYWQALCLVGWKLKGARPSMNAAIGSAIIQALSAIRKNWEECGLDISSESDLRANGDAIIQELVAEAERAIDAVISKRGTSAQALATNFKLWLEKKTKDMGRENVRILTLSYSSSMKICLEYALQELPSLTLELRIIESRPGCEGANLGTALISGFSCNEMRSRLSIQVETDSSIAMLAKDVDILLLGADRISSNGDVSNKMGSLAAAICAKTLSLSVEVIVVSESSKIAGVGEMGDHAEEENDRKEVAGIWNLKEG